MKTLLAREILHAPRPFGLVIRLHLCRETRRPTTRESRSWRSFHSSQNCRIVRPYLLADIGEGITECQIIDWLVKPGDYVQQFDPICEVQSDKASVEITSRFDGTIKALHYAVDDMAIVGKPILDIDIVDDVTEREQLPSNSNEQRNNDGKFEETGAANKGAIQETMAPLSAQYRKKLATSASNFQVPHRELLPEAGVQVTPAVRRMLKELGVHGSKVQGTGKDGRITKEDVHRHNLTSTGPTTSPSSKSPSSVTTQNITEDRLVALSLTEMQMFKVMTSSLTIPHFLHTHHVDITLLNSLRRKFNTNLTPDSSNPKLSLLPFVVKALSHVFLQYTKLNSHLDMTTNPTKPQLLVKAAHNFGVAVDTPQGLLVPVVRNVQSQDLLSLAADIKRLSSLAKEGRLTPDDFKGATFTVSNIGSIGGSAVNPVIVAPMLGIVAVGRVENVPMWKVDEQGAENIVKGEQVVLSWSADHRVIDGATLAKAAEMVGKLLKNAETFGLALE